MTDPRDTLIKLYEALIETNQHRMYPLTGSMEKRISELKEQINAPKIERKIVEPISGALYYAGVDPISGEHPMSNHTEFKRPIE